jgi:hypothetical protein
MKKSNKLIKTKKAMKKTFKFLSMAALALVGAVMTGCSNDDDNIEQPANTSKVVTLTTTVGLDGGGSTTRALTAGGVKTFAVGEKMALIYYKGGTKQKAESNPLASTDITEEGKKATFTFELDTPNKSNPVMYIYPASMANNDASAKLDYLASQDGTLGSLARNLDLAVYTGHWVGDNLPTGTLANQLAVLALTLKDNAGSSTITSGLTQVTVSDGTNTYTVAPTSGTFGTDVIYVAIRPVTAALQYTATDGTTNYTKTATSREYEPGNFYNLGLRMVEPEPAGPTTVTWNSSNVSDLSVWGTYVSYEKEGITLRGNAEWCDANWADYGDGYGINFNMNASGGYTFTAPDGKKFTKIEMIIYRYEGWYTAAYDDKLGSGWPSGEDAAMTVYETNKVTWTGDAASVDLLTDAGLGSFGGTTVSSIEFTLE